MAPPSRTAVLLGAAVVCAIMLRATQSSVRGSGLGRRKRPSLAGGDGDGSDVDTTQDDSDEPSSSSSASDFGSWGALPLPDGGLELVTPDGEPGSFWHDIPLPAGEDEDVPLYHFVTEIPGGTLPKMEVQKGEAHNPIRQDTKNGKPRVYPLPLPCGYGMLPQTYEHPGGGGEAGGGGLALPGDGDPLDVLDISQSPRTSGEVAPVRVIGAVAMVDDGAADWNVLVVSSGEAGGEFGNVVDIGALVPTVPLGKGVAARPPPPSTPQGTALQTKLDSLVSFFREYKKKTPGDAAEASPVQFALGGGWVDAAAARRVVESGHVHWCSLVLAPAEKEGAEVVERRQAYKEVCEGLDVPTLPLPKGIWV